MLHRKIVCCHKKCEQPAVVTIRWETDKSAEFTPFCRKHMVTAVKVMQEMIRIEGEEERRSR